VAGARCRTDTGARIGEPRSRRWTVLYDADCGFCKWTLSVLLRWDRAARVDPVALQRPEAADLLTGLTPAERMASWHLISPSGERLSGGDALSPLLLALPGGRLPAAVFARFPRLTARGYRWVAEHRSRLSGWVPPSAKQRAGERVQAREQLWARARDGAPAPVSAPESPKPTGGGY
jgi:predicted DCC family thiol-disulfide oxidoreductase YuxK